MLTDIWTISINGGAYATLDSLGVKVARRHLASLNPDTLSLIVSSKYAADSTPLFQYGDTIKCQRNGVNWFQGVNISNPRTGSPSSESIQYTIANAWWDLTERIYMQQWAIYVQLLFQLQRKPHVFLGYETLWNGGINPQCAYAGIKTSIQDILDFAIANGAPLAYDLSILPDIVTPVIEDKNISCASAIIAFCRWIPDIVAYFDYSTNPYPTLRFKRRADLAALSFPLGTAPLSSFELTPRYDLQRPCVKIYWERTDTIQGAQVPIEQIEIYPPTATGLERGAYIASVDLLGYSSSSVSAKVQIAQLDATSQGFWASRFPSHHDGITRSIVGVSQVKYSWQNTAGGTVIDTTPPYGHMLIGTWYAWMPFHALQVTCQCQAHIIYKDQTGVTQDRTENLSCQVISCDAAIPSGGWATYSTLATFESGEDIPNRVVGDVTIPLSEDIFSAVGPLHYSGTIQLAEADCGNWSPTASNLIGCGLNITGSAQSDWAAMNAMIQTIDEDWGSGSTSIAVGPPEHLSPQDLKDLCALTRNRYKFRNPGVMSGASLASGSTDLTSSGGDGSSSNGLMGFGILNVGSPKGALSSNALANDGISLGINWAYANAGNPAAGVPDGGTPLSNTGTTIALNTKDCIQVQSGSASQIHPVKIRPLPFCTLDGHQLTILVASSMPYDSAGAEHDPFETTTAVPS